MRFTRSACRGLTLVELLVVIFIIGLLVALLIPGVSGPRVNARRTHCANNLKQLALATEWFASTHKRYPGLIEEIRVGEDQTQLVSWAAMLAPGLERREVWERIVEGEIRHATAAGSMTDAPIPPIDLFTCPSEEKLVNVPNYLDYSANSGAWDEGHVEVESADNDSRYNGIFHMLHRNGPTVRSADILHKDVTILFAENVDKDATFLFSTAPTRYVDHSAGWLIGGEQQLGIAWAVPVGGTDRDWEPKMLRINRTDDTVAGPDSLRFARPASRHPGVVNAAFVGGNVEAVSENIDYTVYVRMMAPNFHRSLAGEPWDAQSVPPLSDAEFKD